jgi:hypothetical protein
VADPNQTGARGDWLCPCSGCSKSIAAERKQLIELFEKTKNDYLVYRGSSFHKDTGELMWAKDDAMAYAEGIDSVIELIKERMPKPKIKHQ